MIKQVYLAGRMTGLVRRGAEWRDVATAALLPLVALDPVKFEFPDSEPEIIVKTDLGAITQSVAVLVYLGLPSWGTAMEIWFAKQEGREVIGFTGPNFTGPLSPWAQYACDEVHETLSEAVNRIREKHLADL